MGLAIAKPAFHTGADKEIKRRGLTNNVTAYEASPSKN
jgi:hypothetical protein